VLHCGKAGSGILGHYFHCGLQRCFEAGSMLEGNSKLQIAGCGCSDFQRGNVSSQIMIWKSDADEKVAWQRELF
jgi:hypothetical protein